MKRSVFETVLGAVVLIIAVVFLFFSYDVADVGDVDGYEINAEFTDIGGLKIGDSVLIAGYKVGNVSEIELTEDYFARVHMNINSDIQLPTDTAALISSQSLLGGRFLGLQPGADEEYLKPNDTIVYTQEAKNIEQLIGQFIFSQQNNTSEEGS